MSWSYRIMLFYLAFAGGIIFMVCKSTQYKTSLVAENYYEKELQYQQVVDAGKNTLPFTGDISIQEKNAVLVLQLPPVIGASVSGEIEWVCLNNEAGDTRMKLRTDAKGKQEIDTRAFKKGNYRVYVSWNKNSTPYYYEASLMVH